MTAILIDPHGDDAALFAAYLCLKHKPLVLVTHLSVPVQEVNQAMGALGCEWVNSSLDFVYSHEVDLVITPAWEKDGLREHNLVAETVSQTPLDGVRFIRYLTYAGHPRRKSRGAEVLPTYPEWIFVKLSALACFKSQAHTPAHQHFIEDMREYVRP